MSQRQSVALSAIELQTLENNLRARRGASVLVIGARCPMEAFQDDLRESAQRLGFQPEGDGRFTVSISPGGGAKLGWEPAKAPTHTIH
ncbi:hypothetical protein QZH45_11465 [Pseudomonas corrugata]|uniref:hypothetical protein n=1 Tax=Pseudomonas corrugata TaxID=47879 RepID=UPI0006D8AE6C|nr:hypothetical protein [Pseudomonas corrugata]